MEIKQTYKVADDRFSVEQIDQHNLVLTITHNRFRFVIRKKENGMVIWFEDYYLGLNINVAESFEKIIEIFENHTFLKANFWNNISLVYSCNFLSYFLQH